MYEFKKGKKKLFASAPTYRCLDVVNNYRTCVCFILHGRPATTDLIRSYERVRSDQTFFDIRYKPFRGVQKNQQNQFPLIPVKLEKEVHPESLTSCKNRPKGASLTAPSRPAWPGGFAEPLDREKWLREARRRKARGRCSASPGGAATCSCRCSSPSPPTSR